MSNLRKRLMAVAMDYAVENGNSLARFLGDGNDGAVWESNNKTAIKALERRDSYLRERDAYLRLKELDIIDIQGFAVPCLINIDDIRQVIEMTIVFPPCILDFAKAYVDHSPDFSPEVLNDWRRETLELFEGDYETVMSILEELDRIGISYFDAKPGNIRFS